MPEIDEAEAATTLRALLDRVCATGRDGAAVIEGHRTPAPAPELS